MIARLNSLNTPWAGGGWVGALPAIATLNPISFTALCNQFLYQNYRVLGSRISFQMAPETALDVMFVTITPSDVASLPASTQTAIGQPYTRSKMISATAPVSSQTVVNKMSVSTLNGIRPEAVLDDVSGAFFGTYTTPPLDGEYWNVNFVPADGTVTSGPVSYVAQIQYDVEFFADSISQNPALVEAKLHALAPVELVVNPSLRRK